ncbi:MAG TPA: sugar ABC transporter ATP-binding protein [Pararobbsia sp.]|nr:sugar ABC transporter ATP-binding protein [Pararobbsia sp.]
MGDGEIAVTQGPAQTAAFRAERVGKSFGPVTVLRDIDLAVRAGEVHAVLGENGAGKSTLVRILSGHYQPDAGQLWLDGKPIVFRTPVDAEAHGVVLIHQEILLADSLTVAQSLFLGRELRRGPLVDDRRMRAIAAERLAELGCHASPDARVRDLPIADRALVQIARALLEPHRVVIFDEPTAVFTPHEAQVLFSIIGKLKAAGTAIIYISHRLNEIEQIADTVTVLRDGRHVVTRPAAGMSQIDMARYMVGRDMSQLYPEKPPLPPPDAPVVLEVRDAVVPGHVEHASFTLRQGEVLGFAGLIGAGRTELFEGILGLRAARIGAVEVDAKPQRFGGARDAFKAGIAYLTEDRKGKGLLLNQTLVPNLTLAALDDFCRGPLLDRAREQQGYTDAQARFDIRAGRRDLLARQLSGGNQQKLLLAKMLLVDPSIVVIDEPTRGIDIGTKSQIYAFIAALAASGKACVVISSEMQELIGLCHRVIVMRAGQIVGEVSGDGLTEDDIVVLATGATHTEATPATLVES